MGISRLLDKEESRVLGKIRPNLSLARLLKIIEPHAPPGLNSRLVRMLSNLKALSEPIDLWRDKRIGHADKEAFLGTGNLRLPDVEQATFEKVLETMYDVLKVVHVHFNGPELEMHFPLTVGYADALMGYIRDGNNARKARIASQFP